MPRKRHKAEEIVAKLRQVDVLTAQGRPVAEAIRSIGVTEVTYYRWRSEYGGLKGDQVKRMKELEAEKTRLRRAVSDLTITAPSRHYNTVRPHQSLGYKPPAPEVFIPVIGARSAPQPRPAPPTALAPKPILH